MTEKRNTAKEKRKQNKEFPYKKKKIRDNYKKVINRLRARLT